MGGLHEACARYSRLLFFWWCNLAIMGALALLLLASRHAEVGALAAAAGQLELEPAHVDLHANGSQVHLVLYQLVLCSIGSLGAWTRNGRLLKLFSLLALCLAAYLELVWERDKRNAWRRQRSGFVAKMAQFMALYQRERNFEQATDQQLQSSATLTWDALQVALQCCGLQGPRDWAEVWFRDQLPVSCCVERPGELAFFHCNGRRAQHLGCLRRIDDLHKPKYVQVYLVSALAAFLLARHFNKQQQQAELDEQRRNRFSNDQSNELSTMATSIQIGAHTHGPKVPPIE